MKEKKYMILGIIISIISFISLISLIFSSIVNKSSIFVDGLWFMILGVFAAFLLGILYLLYGFNKLKINRLSEISVKFIIVAFAISIIGVPLVYLLISLTGSDPMGLLLIIPVLFVSCFISIIALVLLIISIFK